MDNPGTEMDETNEKEHKTRVRGLFGKAEEISTSIEQALKENPGMFTAVEIQLLAGVLIASQYYCGKAERIDPRFYCVATCKLHLFGMVSVDPVGKESVKKEQPAGKTAKEQMLDAAMHYVIAAREHVQNDGSRDKLYALIVELGISQNRFYNLTRRWELLGRPAQPHPIPFSRPIAPLDGYLRLVQKELIQMAFHEAHGSAAIGASILGVSRSCSFRWFQDVQKTIVANFKASRPGR